MLISVRSFSTTIAAFFLATSSLQAQVSPPGFSDIGAVEFGNNQPIYGSLSNATGVAGSGYTTFRYGDQASLGSASGVYFAATSGAPSNVQLTTTTPTGSAAPVAPSNFSASNAYTFNVFRPSPGESIARIFIPATPGGTNYLDLTDQTPSNVAQATIRLNESLRFDASRFIDPATNAPISAGAGIFRFELDSYNATAGYQNINLTYTPVPEPTGLLAAAGFGALAIRFRRRLRRA